MSDEHDEQETTDEIQPMMDDTDDETAGESETSEPEASSAPAAEPDADESGSDLRRKANYALLAGLSLLALIAALQFYLNASSVINQWVTREYRSLFQALFNLVVLLIAGAGITRQVTRLTD